MSSNNESNCTYNGAVLVIILVLSLLSEPVMGKPMLGTPEEELPYFQSTDPDRAYFLKWKLIIKDPFDESHVSDAVQPLFRLLRLQNPDGITTDHGINTARPRVRFGKRRATADFTGDFLFVE